METITIDNPTDKCIICRGEEPPLLDKKGKYGCSQTMLDSI